MLHLRLMSLLVAASVVFGCGENSGKKAEDKTTIREAKKVEASAARKNILFFGTSLTAGYGLEPEEAYPSLIQNRIDSLKMPYKVINGGLSGETSAGGKGRIDWLLKQPVDIFVLELGANDGLRGISVAETTKNLQFIIDQVKAKYPKAKLVIAGMQLPPSMGQSYATAFKNMFPGLAAKNNMALIPFLLDKVGGVAKLNQADGIHPTAEGDKILAENVWSVLKDLL
ncbi:arylesterase [Pedobacter sp. MC2016-14]|uniref:arylesterase n=1 Tax=Pedobacter sp. MC2016-14 TaxID=2897327 RepID=UPI001E3F7294|nr:arylesterase [Pedobacter sp. MC2016-14]MCD0489294.1 arylesterase [Pedobacter sp. MC2016-14]